MATDCQTCCDDLQCQVDAINTNIDKLFGRTDDIAAFLEGLDEDGDHVYRVVHNEDELMQAIALGGQIYVDAPIVIGPALEITVDGTQIIGMNNDAAIIRQHNNTFGIGVIVVQAQNVVLRKLKVTSNHPKVNNTSIEDVAILISDSHDVSGLLIEHCEIYDCYHGIFRQWASDGGSYAPRSSNVKILHNYLHSLVGYGMYLKQHFESLTIDGNVLIGEVSGQDEHENEGNGIWLGNNSDFVAITYNRISRFGRHGIEYWNSQHIPAEYTDGNRSADISHNWVFDMQNHTGATLQNFCITAFGNESLTIAHNRCIGGDIGIEVYNDRVTDGEIILDTNYVDGASNQGLSINGIRNGMVIDNTVKNVEFTHGVQIINGCRDTVFRGNKLYDAGERAMFINAFGLTITGIQIANNGWITVAEDMSTGDAFYTWMLGKQVTFKDIVGTTELNDNYYTITEIDSSGAVGTHKIRLGINMSAFTPWVSGGYFKESFRNLVFENNTFWHSRLIGSSGNVQSFYLSDVNQAVIRNNTAWYVNTISSNKFFINGYSSVFIDIAGAAVTAAGYFVGDNRRIAYKASN